jgi:hypothetical protein
LASLASDSLAIYCLDEALSLGAYVGLGVLIEIGLLEHELFLTFLLHV